MSTVYTAILDKDKKILDRKVPHECFYYVPGDFKNAGEKAVYVRYFPSFNTREKLAKEFYTFAETFPFFQEKEESLEELLENKTVTINARKIQSRKLLSILFLARYPDEFPILVEAWSAQESKEKHPFKAFVRCHKDGGIWNCNHTFFEPGYPEDLEKVFDPSAKTFMKELEKSKFIDKIECFGRGIGGFTNFYQTLENYK